MSYKIEIIDEYSHGEWFSHSLRFTTEAEAVDCSRHFEGAGWHGIIDLRVVPSDDPVNARRTEKGTTDQDGKPFYTPPPTPSPEEHRAEADRLGAAWDAIVARLYKPGQKRS
ncbi:MAG: hypothetical protein ABSD53_12975 [Terriglobales bacterium]|jgi:hypothetical protein